MISTLSVVAILLLAPSIDYVLFCYLPCSVTTLIICVFRYSLDRKLLLNTPLYLLAMVVFWYILQMRELKRFFEQQDAKSKEIKATEKEVELTNVLNLHQDVVVIYTAEETQIENLDETPRDLDLNIEFSNNRSIDVFGIDLSQLSARQLVLP